VLCLSVLYLACEVSLPSLILEATRMKRSAPYGV
jgi:hypothetical protein